MKTLQQTEELNYPMLQVDPVLEVGIKEMIRTVIQQKATSIAATRIESFVEALYEVIRRVSVTDELTEEQYNKMQSTMMDGLGKVYFDDMDFDTLTLDKVNEFQDELIAVVAECLSVVDAFMENLTNYRTVPNRQISRKTL